MDFLLASVSQVFEATSVVWRWGVPRANVNRVQRRGEGDKKKWFRTIISVYTWRRSQKAVDTAQTLMWMCIHRKPRRKHTHTETEWIMSTQQSRDFLLSHQFNVSIFVDLPEISLLVQKWETGVMNEVSAPLSALCFRNENSVSCTPRHHRHHQWFSYTSGSQSILRDQFLRDPRTGYVSVMATLNFKYFKLK